MQTDSNAELKIQYLGRASCKIVLDRAGEYTSQSVYLQWHAFKVGGMLMPRWLCEIVITREKSKILFCKTVKSKEDGLGRSVQQLLP